MIEPRRHKGHREEKCIEPQRREEREEYMFRVELHGAEAS